MTKTAEDIGKEYQEEMKIIAQLLRQLNSRIIEANDRMYNQLAKAGLAAGEAGYAKKLADLLDTPDAMRETGFGYMDEAVEEMSVQVGATLGVPDED
jgi:hypothetical protein